MLSLRARLVVCAMTHRHLLRPPFRRTDSDWSTFAAIERFRQEVERGAGRFGRLPVGIESNPVDCGGIRAEWVSPAAAVRDRALLYFHGGGYVSGSIPAHRAIVAKFAGGSAIPALLFEYRLAPEHRFPAALEDALAVYRWLLSEGKDPSHIAFCG
ncbi:MAG: alpha/beta hydrolase fold domain-containing protein, partial [Syntrophomonadaceae bacterium]|nr:alpha/beta hydrolase fold domain-containing protein [Syntrophomonadaceae bacterium]